MTRSSTLMTDAAGTCATLFDRSGKPFRNVDTLLPDCTTLHQRRQQTVLGLTAE